MPQEAALEKTKRQKDKKTKKKKKVGSFGIPVVAQWLTNLARNNEIVGSIPGLAQWVKNPTLP